MTILEWMKRWRAKSGARNDFEERLRKYEESVDPFNPFPEPVRIEITDVIDLHTIQPREVRKVVEEYLLEARRAGFPSVRIIHGKGKGLQRDLVRKILDRTPFVVEWMDAPPGAGGWGATIAHLLPEEDK
jgi:dsDNA-specific endonuclease/ATPase MutS2